MSRFRAWLEDHVSEIGFNVFVFAFCAFMAFALSSCSTAQELVDASQRIQETRLNITDDITVTKNGMHIGNLTVEPTRFRPQINGQRYPVYYGVTLTYTFGN